MSGTAIVDLPLWAAVIVSVLLVLAGLLCLLGSLGLLRLPHFYQRMHAPSISITLGTGCMLLASIIYSSWQEGRFVLHELAITALVLLTAPVVAMMLMRAAVYRDMHARQLRGSGSSNTGRVNAALDADHEELGREAAQERGMDGIANSLQPRVEPRDP